MKVKDNVIVTNSDKNKLIDLSGLAINTDETNTFGIMYDPISNTVDLGLGTITTEGKFTFNENEGLPLAIRDRNSSFTQDHLISWSTDKNKLVDSGIDKSVIDNKVDKVEKGIYWQAYGIGTEGAALPENDGKTINISQEAIPNTLINRDAGGIAKINNPINDLDIANKQYVDGRFDYVALSKTRFILNNILDEDDRQLLLNFYDKHYGKTKIPLFVVDAKGDIASVRMDNLKYFYFSVLTYAEKPIIMSIQPTLPNRKMGSTSAYLHSILGQNSWKNEVVASIGINNDNKLIITDGSGTETPGQTPSVVVPPFTKEDSSTFALGDILKLQNLKINSLIYFEDYKAILVWQTTYFQIRMPNASGGTTDYNFHLRDDGGGEVALKQDLDNFERKTVLSNVLPTDNILLDLHNYQLESAITSDFSFIMPTDASDEYLSEISFTTGPTLVAFTTTSAITFTGEDCSNTYTFVPDTNKHYSIIFWKDKGGFQAVVRGY